MSGAQKPRYYSRRVKSLEYIAVGSLRSDKVITKLRWMVDGCMMPAERVEDGFLRELCIRSPADPFNDWTQQGESCIRVRTSGEWRVHEILPAQVCEQICFCARALARVGSRSALPALIIRFLEWQAKGAVIARRVIEVPPNSSAIPEKWESSASMLMLCKSIDAMWSLDDLRTISDDSELLVETAESAMCGIESHSQNGV